MSETLILKVCWGPWFEGRWTSASIIRISQSLSCKNPNKLSSVARNQKKTGSNE